MNKFHQSVAGVLEVDVVDNSTDFRQIAGWCSLQGFGLLVLMENDWATPMNIQQFLTMRTVGDLFLEAFITFAASILKVEREKLSGDTTYGSIPEWDSVNHLRLAMEAESRFGLNYPIERIPELQTLRDFIN